MGKGRRQRVQAGLQISPRSSRRRNRRARYAIGREGKGGSLPREGQAIVQIRGAHWPYRLGLLNRSRSVARAPVYAIAPCWPASHHGSAPITSRTPDTLPVRGKLVAQAALPVGVAPTNR